MDRPIAEIPRWRTLRNAPKFLKDPIALMESNIKQYGSTYRFQLGNHPAIFTADPGFIQHVLQKQHRKYIKSPPHFEKLARYLGHGLLTIDGPYWLRQRRLIQPGFHRQRIASLATLMNQVIDDFIEDFDDQVDKEHDLFDAMQELAFQIIARSIFNLQIDRASLNTISNSISEIQRYVIKEIRTPFLIPWLKVSGQQGKTRRLAAQNDEIILKLIRDRKLSGEPMDDLLQMLLDARYEDDGEAMSDQQLLDEVKILFVAGHDTSGNALSWTLYLLAKHPEWQKRLQTEVDKLLNGRLPEVTDLKTLEQTTQVIQESMRLFPPAWITDRMSISEDHYKGVDIEKGTLLITFLYGAHHHPGHWTDPESFRPDRFSPEQRDKINSAAYLPFGAGPRLCIGNSFAMMEMQLVLSRLLQRYTFRLSPNTQIEKLALVTLKPKYGVRLMVEKRT